MCPPPPPPSRVEWSDGRCRWAFKSGCSAVDSALDLGSRGRQFESGHPDQLPTHRPIVIIWSEVIIMIAICSVCGKEYEMLPKKYNEHIKNNWRFYCSPECMSHRGSVKCRCANCGKELWKHNSELKRSKSGNIFCCVSCGVSFNNSKNKRGENNPNWSNGATNYRAKAFNLFEHKCVVCGFDEDERLLEVHHVDEDRDNNDNDNLVILCPLCHKKLTLHIGKLVKCDDGYHIISE